MTTTPEIHGHRGCRGLLPENTLPGFLHALALGVDALEMDVVISADGEVVVSHEPWLSATTCLDPHGQPIAPADERDFNLFRLPYATIRACNCGQLPHPGFPLQMPLPGAHKPLLREVLAATEAVLRPAPPRYAIELKSTPAGDGLYHPAPAAFVAAVLATLAGAAAAPGRATGHIIERVTLMSFDARILQAVRHQAPGLVTCLLSEDGRPWLESIADLGFVPTTFGPDYQSVLPAAVRALREAHPGLRLVPWTVNDPATMRRLAALGVDGLTTDYPDQALAALRG